MQFDLSETQQLLKTSAREFFPAECPISEVRRLMETDTAYDPALWRKMAEQGWTGMIFPERFGGLGLGLVEMAVAFEEMGKALVPGPYLATLLAGAAIDAAGSDAHKEKYLAPICRGDARATLAADQLETVQLNGAALSGRKLFVMDAAVADFVLCPAGLALCVVDSKAAGLRITPLPALDATRKLYEVAFDNVEVSDVLGETAAAAIAHAMEVATVALVAEMVGGMQRVLEMTVAYAKTRKQFGRPIGQFQAVQHMCADMLLYTESARSAAYYAAWALSEKTPDSALAVSVAKAYASDAYREVGNRGIQVHGGMGFTWENDLHLYYRRAKASELLFGDASSHRERITRLLMDHPQAAM